MRYLLIAKIARGAVVKIPSDVEKEHRRVEPPCSDNVHCFCSTEPRLSLESSRVQRCEMSPWQLDGQLETINKGEKSLQACKYSNAR